MKSNEEAPSANSQGVLSEKSQVKENRIGGKRNVCACISIHTRSLACVYTECLLQIDTPEMGNIGYL